MQTDVKRLLRKYISNIQVNLLIAGYTHVWQEWGERDYTPEYNKFYFVSDGEGWLKIGGKEFYPRPGQFFIMPAGVLQSFSTISPNTFTKYWCHFTATIGDKNLFDIIQLPYYIDVQDHESLTGLFIELVSNYNGENLTSCLRAKAALIEIIAFYLENTTIEDIQISNTPSVEKLNYVLTYIEKNLSRNITVGELARIVHLHPNYFIKFFRTHFGSSPIHYINKMKMDRAKSLLSTAAITVTEVAEAIGFNDIYHFSKAFKNYTGFSPKEYRNTVV